MCVSTGGRDEHRKEARRHVSGEVGKNNANRGQKPHINSHEKTLIYLTAKYAENAEKKLGHKENYLLQRNIR